VPSTFLKNRWVPVLATLTETGFLHCFVLNESRHKAILKTYESDDEQPSAFVKLLKSMSLKRHPKTLNIDPLVIADDSKACLR
jgi:hypothetical protein